MNVTFACLRFLTGEAQFTWRPPLSTWLYGLEGLTRLVKVPGLEDNISQGSASVSTLGGLTF